MHSANLGFRLDAYLDARGVPLVNREEDADLWRRLRRTGVRLVADAAISVATSARSDGRVREGFAHALNRLYARIDPRCRIGGTEPPSRARARHREHLFHASDEFDDQHIGEVDSSRARAAPSRIGNDARRLGERGRQAESVNAGAEVSAARAQAQAPVVRPRAGGVDRLCKRALQSGSSAMSGSMDAAGRRHL